MSERLTSGMIPEEKLFDIIDQVSNSPKKTTKEFELKVKQTGATEITKEMKALNEQLEKFQKLNQVQKNSVKLFGTQEQMINNLKKSWNEYATAVKNGLIDNNGNILVSKDNTQLYRQARGARTGLMSSYNAANIAIGVDKIDASVISEKIKAEMDQVVSSLKKTDSFKNYNLSEDALKPVYTIFTELQQKASDAGVTVKDVLSQIGVAFNHVSGDINIDQLLSVFDMMKRASEEGAEASEESARRTESATEREAKAIENLEQIRQRAYASRKKTYDFSNNSEFNNEMYTTENSSNRYGEGRWVEIANDDFESYSDALKRLNQLRDTELEAAKHYQNMYAKSYNNGNDQDAKDYLQRMEESLEYYNKFSDAVQYVQNQIANAALKFKPGDQWGANEISNLIQLMQDLVREIGSISAAIGKVDDNSGVTTILQQFSDLAVEISHVALQITNLQKAINSMNFNIDIHAGGNNPMIQNTLITNARREALDVYKDYYNSLADYLTDDRGALNIFAGKGDLAAKYFDIFSDMNPKSVNNSLYTYQKAVDILKEAASLSGVDISPVIGQFEPKAEAANQAIQKLVNTEEQAAKGAEEIKKMFGGGNVQLPIDPQQIENIIQSLQTLQSTLQTGLGLTQLQDGGVTTYFDTLIDKMQQVIDKSANMITILQNIPQNIMANNLQVNGASNIIDAEQNSLNGLRDVLVNTIPEAVDKKTQAFRSEQIEVDDLINLEINKIRELAQTLQTAFAASGDIQNYGALSELMMAINTFANGEDIVKSLDTLSASIERLVKSLSGANDISAVSGQLVGLFNSVKLSKANITNMLDLAIAIELLVGAFRELGKSASMPNILQPINDIIQNAEALKDLSKILSYSAKERRAASVQAGINPDAEEKKANAAAEKQLKNLTKYYAIQDEKNYRRISGKNNRQSVSAMEQEKNLLQSINDYEQQIEEKRQQGIQLTEKENEALTKRQQLEQMLSLREKQYGTDKQSAESKKYEKRKGEIRDFIDKTEKDLMNGLNINQNLIDPKFNSQISKLKQDFQDLKNIQLVDENDITQAERLKKQIAKTIAEIKKNPNYTTASSESRTSLQAKAGKWLEKNTASPDYLREQVSALYSELSSDVPVSRLKEITAELNRIEAEAAKAGKTGRSFSDMLGTSFKNLGRYLLSFASFYRIIGVFKRTVNTVKELDTALMEVRKVSTETLSSLREWQDITFLQADQVGGTAKQIQESTASWLRLGKTFSEAQEAAQASVKLLNVSEFTNINDATTSLVSMKQAFKDLSYEDFIDKLNGVGDNFSSSTDKLASGMQNVSSVLKVAGNDIDQSLALLTAANDITQDMSKASMGVRTVALRIAGTEEAKEELEEMGEDTSDFVVQTSSKVDAKVRRFTATQDNPNGISVLDNTGRLRSTYDILLDISKIYDKIVEKDNKYGTNTSNALLELLAGKTRSNILASILQNPTLLEESYEQSKNSQGIGQRELDIYLDSVQAKMTQFQNAIQELSKATIDSDWLKVLIDLGTQAVKVFASLTEKFGSLGTIVSPILSMFLQRKGFGLLPSKNGPGLLGSIITKGKSKLQTAMLAEQVQMQRRELFNITSGANYNQDALFFDYMTALDGQKYSVENLYNSNTFGPLLNGMSEVEAKALTMGRAIGLANERLNATVTVASQAGGGLSKLGGKLAGLGKSFLNFSLTTIVITAFTKLLQLITKAVVDFMTVNDRVIEAGKNARKEVEELSKAYTETEKKTKDLGERYNKLRKGVSYSNRTGYSNNTLTEDEYAEFLQINKEIVDLYPQLRAGTDAQGNAYVNLGTNAKKATEQLEKYLKIQEKLQNKKIGETFETQLEGILAEITRLDQSIADTNFDKTTAELAESGIDKYVQQYVYLGGDAREVDVHQLTDEELQQMAGSDNRKYTITLQQEGGINEDTLAAIENSLGAELDEEIRFWDEAQTDAPDEVRTETVKISFTIDEDEEDVHKRLDEILSNVNREVMEVGEEKEFATYEDQRKKEDDFELLRQPMIASIKETRTYQKLSEEMQAGVNEMYSNINIADAFDVYSQMTDEEKKAKNVPKFIDYLKKQYLYVIDSALQGVEDLAPEQVERLLNQLFTFDDSKMFGENASEKIDELVSQLFPDEQTQHEVKVALNFEYKTDSGKYESIYDKNAKDLYSELGDYEETGISIADIKKNLNQQQISDILTAKNEGKFTFNKKGIQELVKWVKNYQATRAEVIASGTFSDILLGESYKDKASEFSTNLSTLSSSMETLRTQGSLTADEMLKLQESFPDMTDFSADSLAEEGFKQLREWIDLLREDYDTLSDEGKEQVNTYIKNMLMSNTELIKAPSSAKNILRNAVYDNAKRIIPSDKEANELANTYYDNISNAIGDRINSEHADEIMFMLEADGSIADGDIQDIVSRWDNYELEFKVSADIRDAEKNIKSLTSQRDLNYSMRDMYEAQGKRLDASFYERDNAVAEGLIAEYNRQMQAENDKYRLIINPTEDQKTAHVNAINAIHGLIFGEQAKMAQNNIQIKLLPSLDYEDVLKEAQLAGEEIQRTVTEAENNGVEVTSEQYEALISNAESQKTANKTLYNFYTTLANAAKLTKDVVHYDEWTQKANEYSNAIVTLDGQIVKWSKSMDKIDTTHLGNQLTQLKNQAQDLQNSFTDTTDSEKAVLYVQLGINAEQQKKNLEQQRQEIIDNFDTSKYKFNDPEYQEYLLNLRNIDEELRSISDSQREWANSLLNTPIDALNKAMEKYQTQLQQLQDRMSLKEAKGDRKTKEDYDEEIKLNNQQAFTNRMLGGLSKWAANGLRKLGYNDLAEQQDAKTNGFFSAAYSNLVNVENLKRNRRGIISQDITDDLNELQREAQTTQNVITQLQETGQKVDEGLYSSLYDNADKQIQLYNDLIEDANNQIEAGVGEEDELNLKEKIASYENAIFQLQNSQREWKVDIQLIPVFDYDRSLKEYQLAGDELQREITNAENNGFEITSEQYDKLIKNAEDQKKVNAQLRDFYSGLASAALLVGDLAHFDEWTQKANGFSDAIVTLDGNIIKWAKDAENIDISHLGNQLTQLKNNEQDLTDDLIDKTIPEKAEIYVQLKINADEQRKNLEQQRQEIEDSFDKSKYTFNDPEYQTYLQNLRAIDEQLSSLTKSQREWTDALLNTPIEAINKVIEKYDTMLQQLQNKLNLKEAMGGRKTYEDYASEIGLNEQEAVANTILGGLSWAKSNILRSFGYSDLADDQEKATQNYQSQANANLVNIANLKRDQRQLPVQEITDDLDDLKNAAQSTQDSLSLLQDSSAENLKGFYDSLQTNAEQQIQLYNDLIDDANTQIENGVEINDERQLLQNIATYQNAIYQLQKSQLEWEKASKESVTTLVNQEIDRLNNEASNLENIIKSSKNNGQRVSDAVYRNLAQNYSEQAQQQAKLAAIYNQIAEEEEKSETPNMNWVNEWRGNAAAANASAIDLIEKQREQEQALLLDELTEKQHEYNDLQEEANKIDLKMGEDETKHRKMSMKRYEELIKNGEKQIKNLEQQRKTLQDLQDKTIIGTDKWRDYQSQIDEVDSSISSMRNNQVGWSETMTSSISEHATVLAQTLETAFSEINSGTGLTRDTMHELEQGFSDLEDYDISKIFYATADGMKFNTEATKDLIDAEYQLQINNLEDAIARETELIEANKDSKDANSFATVQNAEANIRAYNAELASLQALYDQQKEALSRYSAWETAQQTKNAGDKYTNLQGSWKDIQEMFSKGLTGTDDFQTFVAFFDEWGMGTVDAYKRNKDMITRYLTENGKGMQNFYDDLVSKGFGTKEGNIYSIAIEDTEAAAHAMGMSEEALKMFMDRGEDYGFTNTWVDTVLDGELKIQDTTEKLIEEQERLHYMQTNGATEDEIKNQQTYIDQLKRNIKNYIENTNDVANEPLTKTYANTIEQLKAIQELRDETFGSEVEMTEGEQKTYQQQLDDAIKRKFGGYSLDQLKEIKSEFEVDLDENSKRVLDEMIALGERKIEIQAELKNKELEGHGINAEEFLGLSTQEQIETLNTTLGIEIDETELQLYREQIESQTMTAKIKTVVDSGLTSYDSLLNMNADQLTQTIGFEVDESNIDEVKAKIQEMSSIKVSLDDSSIAAIGDAIATAANTDTATETVDTFVEETDKKTGTVTIDADTKAGESKVDSFINDINAEHPSIRVAADTHELQSSIQDGLNSREFSVNVKANVVGAPGPVSVVDKPAKGSKQGTANVRGTAMANGNAGDLLGEVGRELVVDPNSGRYYTVGDNGPEMTDLPDDAIVFNNSQTEDLLRHGHTRTHGRALVSGNAFASTDQTNEWVYNDTSNTFGTNNATKDNTKATKDNTKSTDKAKTALDKFNDWLGKFVDWVDNRIDRLSNTIERFEKTAEQAISYVSKNNNVQKAMDILSSIPTFLNGQLKTKTVKGTNGVTAQIATGVSGAKKGTLLGDTMRGAVRYQKQADKVMKKAVKMGLLSQKKANEIAKLIQTGEIDIRKYNEKVRAVITAYEDWFGKSQELIDSTYELRQQFKELEQTKLDNITERFETLTSLYEAMNSASEATVDYYTTAGRAVNTKDRKEMSGQLGRQKLITKEIQQEYNAYSKELTQAAKIFGFTSNEYREVWTKQNEIAQALTESRTAELELTHAIEELRFTVRALQIERLESFVDKLENIASLAEKRGTNNALGYKVTEDPYVEQLKYNNDLIVKYAEDLEDRKKEIARRTVYEGLEVNSQEYQDLYNQIVKDEQQLYNLYSTYEDLKMSIRNLRWKEYKKFQETLDKISSDFSHIQSFIREGEILDNDGQFTARGFAQVALIGEDMDVATKKIANARVAIEKLNDELANGTINEETFGQEFEEQMKIIQNSASKAYDDMQKLADLYIKQITAENDILQDLIKKRQEALSAKKSYYDWDKQIRQKNKDILQLQAQVQALEGVTTDAAKAKRAQLQAQLAEAEEDMADTRYEHQIEVMQQGYDKLSEDMQKALDDTIKLINGDQKELQKIAGFMLDQLRTNEIDEKEIIDGIIEGVGTKIHDETQTQLDDTLTQGEETNELTLLTNLLTGEGGSSAIVDILNAIDNQGIIEAIETIDPVVNITMNSDNEDIKSILKEIEDKYLKLNSTQGTDGGTAHDENIANPGKVPEMQDYIDDVAQKNKMVKETTLQNELNALQAKLKEQQDRINDLKQKEDQYTAYLQERKKRAKSKDIQGNTKKQKEVEKQIASLTSKRDDVITKQKIVEDRITDIITQLREKEEELKQLNEYRSGSRRIKEDELAWTNEDFNNLGAEMIVRKSDGAILTPLKANDSIIPANLADNLFKWGAISPDKFLSNPFLGKMGDMPSNATVNNQVEQQVEMHFDSLFNIQGNVDADVMDRLEEFGKALTSNRNFQQNVVKFVTKDFVRESKKQGGFR